MISQDLRLNYSFYSFSTSDPSPLLPAICNKKVRPVYRYLCEGFGYDWPKVFSTEPNQGKFIFDPRLYILGATDHGKIVLDHHAMAPDIRISLFILERVSIDKIML